MSAQTAPKAPVLGKAKATEVALEASVFGAELKPHLVHETVRAEMNAARAGTRASKSRGLVAGGRSKPWRQKGTGRARQGTTRAPHFTGGGVTFAQSPRSFELKVNRKTRRAALRGVLSNHVANGTFALVEGSYFDAPSTKRAAELIEPLARPTLVVAAEDEDVVLKSFRNLDRVLATIPSELEVAGVVWARSVLVTEAALPEVMARAGAREKSEVGS